MDFTITFLELFWVIIKIAAPVILMSIVIIVVLGQIAGRFQNWAPGEALYWSFITATTVGYGDLRPTHRWARILAVVIALNGLILFGMIASIAVTATTEASRLHITLDAVEEYEEIIEEYEEIIEDATEKSSPE